MRIFLYCSYDSSEQGFVLSELTKDGLSKVDDNALPREAADFLNYDHFKLIWRDIHNPELSERFNLQICRSICGIRDLTGISDGGRTFYANIVFVCLPDEAVLLKNLMSHILNDYATFEKELIAFLRIGGECKYTVDSEAIFEWLEPMLNTFVSLAPTDAKGVLLCDIFSERQKIRIEPELIRFAVIKTSWRSISPYLGRKLYWYFCPNQVIDSKEFKALFE